MLCIDNVEFNLERILHANYISRGSNLIAELQIDRSIASLWWTDILLTVASGQSRSNAIKLLWIYKFGSLSCAAVLLELFLKLGLSHLACFELGLHPGLHRVSLGSGDIELLHENWCLNFFSGSCRSGRERDDGLSWSSHRLQRVDSAPLGENWVLRKRLQALPTWPQECAEGREGCVIGCLNIWLEAFTVLINSLLRGVKYILQLVEKSADSELSAVEDVWMLAVTSLADE